MDNIINIVCSYQYNTLLKRIEYYKMDLGKNLTRLTEKNMLEANIKDNFVSLFLKENGNLCHKIGIIGAISIYNYSKLQPNEIIIYRNNIKYVRFIDLVESNNNIEKSLAELIWSLDDKGIEQGIEQ